MANYKLTQKAKEDLARIYHRGIREFGETQADAYYMALFARFERISEQPFLYPSVEYIRDGYRRSVFGSDNIYYRAIENDVEILRVLGQQDTQKM